MMVCAGCSTGSEPTAEPARPGTPAPVPEARTEVGAGRLGESIVVLGGLLADGRATARVDRFDLRTGRWSGASDLPEPLHHAGVASFRGRLFVAGGYAPGASGADGQWIESHRVWSLGEGDREWREEPPLAKPRGALGLAATADHLVAFGGVTEGRVVATVEVLEAAGAGWRAGPDLSQPREHTAAAALDGRVYAIGGRTGGLETNLATVESLDPATPDPRWRAEPPLRQARGGIAAAAVDAAVCVAGGEEPAGTIATVECLSDGRWRVGATLSEPRHGLGVVAVDGDRIHVLAGGPQPGLFVSTAHEILEIEG